MRRKTLLAPAVAALLVAGCAGDDEATPTPTPADTPTAQATATPDETATPSPTPGGTAGGTADLTLDEVLDEPELYRDQTITATATIQTVIEGANAFVLEAGDGAVLLIPPADASLDVSEGDTVFIEGDFREFNPAQVGEIEGVVDEAAIVDEFDGEYVIVAESVEATDN